MLIQNTEDPFSEDDPPEDKISVGLEDQLDYLSSQMDKMKKLKMIKLMKMKMKLISQRLPFKMINNQVNSNPQEIKLQITMPG